MNSRGAALTVMALLAGGCQGLNLPAGPPRGGSARVPLPEGEIGSSQADGTGPDIRASTRLSAARMLEADGHLEAAAEQYRRVVDAEPENVEAYTRLGIVYNRLRRFEDAVRVFRRAIELQPNRAYLYNNLGFCHVLQRQYRPAEAAFRRALALQPNYQRARMNLGAVLAETGRNDEALAEFERVVPPDVACYNLGLILAAGKRYAAAEQAFRRSVAFNPDNQEAREHLARLARDTRRDGHPGLAARPDPRGDATQTDAGIVAALRRDPSAPPAGPGSPAARPNLPAHAGRIDDRAGPAAMAVPHSAFEHSIPPADPPRGAAPSRTPSRPPNSSAAAPKPTTQPAPAHNQPAPDAGKR